MDPGESLCEMMLDLLKTGRNSDLILVAHGRGMRLHKAIVCAQSPVIDAAVKGDSKRPGKAFVRINPVFDWETVRRFVRFLYTGVYDDKELQCQFVHPTEIPPHNPESGYVGGPIRLVDRTNPLLDNLDSGRDMFIHFYPYVMARHYKVPKLRAETAECFEESLRDFWEAWQVIDVACTCLGVTTDDEICTLLVDALARRLKGLTEAHNFYKLECIPGMLCKVMKKCDEAARQRDETIRQLKQSVQQLNESIAEKDEMLAAHNTRRKSARR